MSTAAEEREHRLVGELRKALNRRNELSVQYMPMVRLEGAELVGLEALVRWEHPELGVVAPSDFVALAERHGLAGALGARVLGIVVSDILGGRLPTDHVAVNVSGAEVADAGFTDQVLGLLEQHGLDPSTLTVEVTETAVAADLGRAAETLLRLRAAGVSVAIDDFGTGHASLDYLASLPCDVVKIDRRFVSGLDVDRRCTAIVQGVVGMAHGLGLTVVAEGVETPHQRDQLLDLRCEEAQGYLFGRAARPEDLPDWALAAGQTPVVGRSTVSSHRSLSSAGQTVLDLAHDLEECRDLQEALECTLEALRRHVAFTGGSLQLVGADGIRLAAAHPPPTIEAMLARLPPGHGVGWAIVTSRELRYLPDIAAPSATVPSRRRRTSTTRDTRSYLGCPLLVAGRAVGLLQIDSVDVDAFAATDQLLVSACAAVLAGALDAKGWSAAVPA